MTNILQRTVVSIIFLIVSNATWSQEREYIIGRLLDSETEEPIVFASIRVKGRSLGVISNIDGSFKISLKYKV